MQTSSRIVGTLGCASESLGKFQLRLYNQATCSERLCKHYGGSWQVQQVHIFYPLLATIWCIFGSWILLLACHESLGHSTQPCVWQGCLFLRELLVWVFSELWVQNFWSQLPIIHRWMVTIYSFSLWMMGVDFKSFVQLRPNDPSETSIPVRYKVKWNGPMFHDMLEEVFNWQSCITWLLTRDKRCVLVELVNYHNACITSHFR